MGFTGKQVIHPGQIPIVNTAFSPTPATVQWATEMIQAFDEHQKSGKVSQKLVLCTTKIDKQPYLRIISIN